MLNIILFEDNIIYKQSITEMLENQQGYQVKAFSHYDEAIRLIETGYVPDLAILDIVYEGASPLGSTPVKDAGFQIAEKLPNEIPVLFISAYGEEQDIKNKSREYSPVDFIDKGEGGSDLKRLVTKINRQFANKRETFRLHHFFSNSYKQNFSVKQREEYHGDDITIYKVLNQKDIISLERFNDTADRNDSSHQAGLKRCIRKELTYRAQEEQERDDQFYARVVYKSDAHHYFLLTDYSWINFADGDTKLGKALSSPSKKRSETDKEDIEKAINRAERELYNAIAVMERMPNTQISPEWEELDRVAYIELYNNQRQAPIILFGQEESVYTHFINRIGTRIKLADGRELEVNNVDPDFMVKQLKVIEEEAKGSISSMQSIGNNGQGYVNLDYITAFSESFVQFKDTEDRIIPTSMLFNTLKILFPHINTSIPAEKLPEQYD